MFSVKKVVDVARFVENAIKEIRDSCGGAGCVLAAVSGGVDSVTSAVLAKKALGDVVRTVFIDTGFMRVREGEKVRRLLAGLLDVELVDRSQQFYSSLLGLEDAEQKRLVFRDTFYKVLGELVSSYGCDYLVQGTIKADVVETVGGVKTQHNVLSEELQRNYGVKVVEPLRELYKNEVREVARYLGIPNEIVARQPFPGPGLLVRTVGRFTLEKLEVVRRATEVVEALLRDVGASQYFAAAWELELGAEREVCLQHRRCVRVQLLRVLATGVRDGRRVYRPVALLRESPDLSPSELAELADRAGVSRFTLLVSEGGSGRYFVSVRAVRTEDFMTADVVLPPRGLLEEVARRLLEIEGVAAVGFDITPKPPATIEYE
jgi:GMP synthase (glutamine-hydrolysing)